MKRRQAIANIFFIAGTAFVAIIGYEWYDLKKKPDLKVLPSYKALIAELAETIIPETDTPGAKSAKVEDFIILFITDCEDTKEQNSFLKGLTEIEAFAYKKHRLPFEKCLPHEKVAILQHFESKSSNWHPLISKARVKVFGRTFFNQLKDLTVIGYCTSEIGCKKGLAYDYMPITYEPCIPLLKHQKSWATK